MKMFGIIFSNIYDAEMGELTRVRTVASLPFGGRYRQVDFVLSNMVNSDITSVGIITKYNYKSLMDHFGDASDWDLNRKNGGLFIIPPFSSGITTVYRGKLEALNSALRFLEAADDEYVLMCDSTVICNIDFKDVLKAHIDSGADLTVVANKEADETDLEQELVLKVKNGKVLDLAIDTIPSPDRAMGMGMYIMERAKLIKVIEQSVSHGLCHFERDFMQKQFMCGNLKINAYIFDGVVLRNKSISSYFDNNLSLLDRKISGDIFKTDRPIYTKVRDEVPSFYADTSTINDCIVADGCVIRGSAENSVIFRGVCIEEGAEVKNSILMQGTRVKKGAKLTNVIADKNVLITDNTVLAGASAAPYIITKGATV